MWNRYQDEHCLPIKGLFDFLCIADGLAVGGSYCNCLDVVDECDKYGVGELLNLSGRALVEAEQSVSALLGWSICEKWTTERVPYPKSYECGNMKQKDGCTFKSVKLKKNRFLKAGKRQADFLGTYQLEYLDLDEDGYREVACVTVPKCEVENAHYEAFFTGYDATRKYQIDSIDKVVDNGDDTCTLHFCYIDLIDPDCLYSKSPLRQNGGLLDLCCCFDGDDSPTGTFESECEAKCPFVKEIDLYCVYNLKECDNAKLVYHGGVERCQCGKDCSICKSHCHPACTVCTDMCNVVRVVPVTVTEDEDGEKVCTFQPCRCPSLGEPDEVEITYYGGGHCDPNVVRMITQAIYKLASAWIPYKKCGCNCELHDILYWQDQTIAVGEYTTLLSTFQGVSSVEANGFNSIVRSGKRGELEAWGVIQNYLNTQCS